jgi:hypothetical protein
MLQMSRDRVLKELRERRMRLTCGAVGPSER